MLKTGRMQKSETDKFDISFGTVAVATLHLADIMKSASVEPPDVIVYIVSVCSSGHDTRATSDRETAGTTMSSRTHCPQAATEVSHSPSINGQCTNCWAREDAIKTSERAVDDVAESNNSQYLKKRYDEEIIM